MTLIQVRVHRPSDTGTIPAGGQLEWTPTAATSIPTSPVTVVLPASFTVDLTDDINEFTAIETGPAWAWRVVETFPGQAQKTRYVLVTGEGPVDYTTLPSVDPATLEPAAQPDVPVWYAYVDALEAEAARSADAADVAKAAALAAQASATGSATAASQSATTAAARAVEAGTSAFNAGSSAATAAGHVTTAQQSAANAAASVITAAGHATNAGTAASAASTAAGVASGHATAAAGSATAAAGSASASQTARLGAEAARDRAELVATAFTIGDVFTSEPGAPASAVIHGEGPFRELDLTLPRGVQGPPLTAVVLDTVTGPETPGATGNKGDKGDKGDAGGFTAAVSINAGHLDTITTPGLYCQTNGANTTVANGYPKTLGVPATLVVYAATSDNLRIHQELVYVTSTLSIASRAVYRRTFYTGQGWSPWRVYNSSRVDETAGRVIYEWDDANGREQLVYGDTGWRDIKTLVTNGWTSNVVYLRRNGDRVTLKGLTLDGTAQTSTTFLTLPTGFRPQHGDSYFQANTVSAAFALMAVGLNGVVRGQTGQTMYGSPAYFEISWSTTEAWPTTLPGSASGSIPSA
ncbi:hypothetical protein LAROYE_28 [Arthrobacter phage Laroye]|uniref:Minor tail protein n=1 Tax=Arthrobacter phage Laroye TaxID=1772305 RepID=A0A0U4K8P0_9CAUD|nr:minor tail protein [Arthrobacter phage Laroye]ALY09555.1 hypothetical protein LAROYE_28 [Arthrobacter phage Laroye]